MASKPTIAAVLAYLHEIYPSRDIGPTTADAWALTFADWDDATLQACAREAARTPGRSFFPTPGEIAACRPAPIVDVAGILRQISALGSYTPNGWRYPRLDEVRDALGDTIARAYSVAGAARCFADDESITQAIARRAFGDELVLAQRSDPGRPLLAAPTAPLRLSAGLPSITDIEAKKSA